MSWLTARGSGMGSVCLMTTYREEDVFLVLVDGAGVGDGVGVFDDADAFSSEDGLVDPEGGGMNGADPDVCGNLVSN